MVTCPRCQQQVDETVRTTCPVCFTPLTLPGADAPPPPAEAAAPSAAPELDLAPPATPSAPVAPPVAPTALPGVRPATPAPPAAAPPILPPNARVSLTGEVIYDDAPSGPPPSYVGNAPAAPPRSASAPRPPSPPRPSAPTVALSRTPVEAPSRSGGSGAIIAAVVVLVLLLAGAGGYWFMMNRTNPKDQVKAYFDAIKKKDWTAVYNMTDIPESMKAEIPDAKTFAAKQEEAGKLVPGGLDAILNGITLEKVGEPTYTDGDASVPITVKVSLLGMNQSSQQNVQLKKIGGVWKVTGGGNPMLQQGGGMPGMGGGGIGR